MSQSTSSPRSSEAHTLSCVSCRQRKVKCAKVYPCPHCVRGGLECIFPARKKDRAPRRNKNTELLSRLSKLEAILVGRRQGQGQPVESTAAAAAVADSLAPTSTTDAANQPHRHVQVEPDPLTSDTAPPPPRLRGDPAAKYVSGEFWANLATEVEGIKTVLEQPSESEEESEDGGGGGGARGRLSPAAGGQSSYLHSPASHVVSQAMFGNAQFANAMAPPLHPRPDRIKKLRDIYFQNADMLIKILHRPTIEKEFDLFIVNPEDNLPSKSLEAVFCAVYFAAITTLSPDECWAQLGEDRAVLVAQYRQGVEVALARADYLNNTSLECLQALTLYNAILRIHNKSRSSWALLALVHRLALAHNLHRDGAGTAFAPYEAEQRRRLWATLVVLDVRAAQDRGTEPLIRADDFTTRAPTNLDDADFGPGSTAPLVGRDGPSDATFSRCTYACSCLFLHLHGPKSGGSGVLVDVDEEEDMMARIRELEMNFIAPALEHPMHFGSAMGANVVRITTLIFWLTIQYPFRVRQPTTKPRVSRSHMLQTAIAIMELQASGPSGGSAAEYEARFAWWRDGYPQWHALAVALAELCVQTEGALVERAWRTVDKILPVWREKVADSRRGALWRPIRKLLRKARERHAEAKMRRLRLEEGGGEGGDDEALLAPAGGGGVGCVPGPVRAAQVDLPPPPLAENTRPLLGRSQGASQSRNAARMGPSPLQAATEVGPTGIPFNTEFGHSANLATATPPPSVMHNAHQWTIDFSDVDMVDHAGGVDMAVDVPQQELDMLDWSAWNDFVVDANVSLENAATPSSEGQEAAASSGTVPGSGFTSSVMTEREMPVGFLFE